MNFTPRSRKSGFGLVEAIIVAAAVALAIAGVYQFYTSVQARERAHTEAQNAVQLTNNILRAYSSMEDFAGVTEARLVTENLIPPGMEVSGTGGSATVGSVFGGTISVSPMTLDGLNNTGLVLTYSGVPKRICAQFVSNAAAGYNFRDINVNSQNVLGTNRSLDEGLATSNCASQNESVVSFTLGRNHSSALNSPGVCTVPSSSPETQTVSCPTGYSGEITRTRTASCPSGATIPVWGAWTTTSNTCSLVCTPDPSSPQTRTSTPCPSGQYGSITERRVSACAPGQTSGSPSWSAWTEVSNTCSAMCVAPADEIRSPGCPAGQSGDFTERRTASCPSPVGAPVWGPWTTLVYTCAQNCVLPTPNPELRWVDTSGNCDAGSTGTKYWQVEQTRTASCPSSTGAPTYTSWANTGNIRNEDTSQCTALCTPETELERWVPREEACPAGFTGSRSWEERQTRTSSCPPGATSPNTSQWITTGERRNFVDECEAQSCRIARGASYTWRQPGNGYDCVGTVPSDVIIPSGQMLTVEGGATVINAVGGQGNAFNFRAAGQAQYVCNAGVLAQTPTAPVCAPTACNVVGSQQVNWIQTGQSNIACTATLGTAINGGGNFSVPVGGDFTVRDTTGPVFGTQQYQCVQATVSSYGAIARTVSTNNSTCYGSCDTTPRPADNTRTFAGCAAGRYGTWTQNDSYESAAFPSCWANSIVNWLPATAPSGACVNCPSPARETRWGAETNGICPANQYGFTNREKEQDRTRSYTCPAGTATLPAPNYTAWTDTGNVRISQNNCANCPSPVQQTQWVAASATATCPANQYGYIGRERQQVRTMSYTCPAGTLTLPSPSYTSWANTNNYRNTTNDCVSCPASVVEEQLQWVDHSGSACAAGQYGIVGREKQQRRTRTRSYNCPAGTATLPSASYTNWSAWSDTGQIRNKTGANTCTACPANFTAKQWVSTTNGICAAGQWGYTTRQREQSRTMTYLCPAGTTSLPAATPLTSWVNTGNVRTTDTSCTNCPANSTGQELRWVAHTNGNCAAGQYGGIGREKEQRRTQSITYSCPAGTTSLPSPTYGAWSGWSDTGNVRNTGTNSCTACPGPVQENQWVAHSNATCSAGQYGLITRQKQQVRTRSYSCPAGTPSLPAPSYTAWADNGQVRNTGGSCTACPGPVQENRWVAHSSATCAAGYYGLITREKQQVRTRSYSCPAGTTSLPGASYTGWADNGQVRNTGGACTGCPATVQEARWDPRNPGCPAGQVGQHTYEVYQTRNRSYSCPAGTTSLPNPSYTGWADTATRRNVVNTCQPACTVWDETTTQYDLGADMCGGRGRMCEPGERYRTVVIRHLCPTGTQVISTGSWVVIRRPVCAPPGNLCP